MSKATPFNGLRNTVAALMRLLDGKADKDKVVSSVNGTGPDAEGNVQVQEGVSSWNDLTDKPFGEEKTVIEWDGVIGDRPTFSPESSVVFARVGDALTTAELANAQLRYFADGDGEYNRDFTIMEQAGLVALVDGETMLCIVTLDAVNIGVINITEAGTYFMRVDSSVGSGYVSSLEYAAVKPIDPKFIPTVEAVVVTHLYDPFTGEGENTFECSHTSSQIVAAQSIGKVIELYFVETRAGSYNEKHNECTHLPYVRQVTSPAGGKYYYVHGTVRFGNAEITIRIAPAGVDVTIN